MDAGQRSVVPSATAKPLREDEAEDQFSRSQDEVDTFGATPDSHGKESRLTVLPLKVRSAARSRVPSIKRQIAAAEPDKDSSSPSSSRMMTISSSRSVSVNDSVLRLWARVLRAVERSRLVLLAPEGSARRRTSDLLELEGVERHFDARYLRLRGGDFRLLAAARHFRNHDRGKGREDDEHEQHFDEGECALSLFEVAASGKTWPVMETRF